MALKPEEANRPFERASITFDELSFFEGVLRDEYIFVVGSGIILDKTKFPESNGDINQYLINNVNRKFGRNFNSISQIASEMSSSLIYHLLIDQMVYDLDDISNDLRRLLELRYFRFVFSTTPDHYLETLLSGIWGNELRIVNISDDRSLESFSNAIKKVSAKNYIQPTLFYVFGKAIKGQQNPTKFLQTDNDAIAYIEKWLKLECDNPIVEFLKTKRLLGIGCNFDDWYYRFFWYILTRDFVSRNSIAPYKADNAVLADNATGLQRYLNNLNVCVHTEPWTVMSYIYHILSSKIGEYSFKDLVNQKRLKGKVFISYKTDPDKNVSMKLFEELARRNSFKVWIDDSSLLGGQPYMQKIPEAIRFSKVFIPVLTSSVAEILNQWSLEDLKEKNNEDGLPFFIQEWKWAKNVQGIEIIPVAFAGYNLKGPEHIKFIQLIYDTNDDYKPSGIDMGESDNMNEASVSKLVSSIRHMLGIYE